MKALCHDQGFKRFSSSWARSAAPGLRPSRCRSKRRQIQREPCWRSRAVGAQEQQDSTSYMWSWSESQSCGATATGDSQFDAAHPLPLPSQSFNVHEALQVWQAAAAAASTAPGSSGSSSSIGGVSSPLPAPSTAWLAGCCAASHAALAQMHPQQLAQVLQAVATLGYTPGPAWTDALLRHMHLGLVQLTTRDLAAVLWSLSNLHHLPAHLSSAFPSAVLRQAQAQLQDFYAPDLCTMVCAAGLLAAPAASWPAHNGASPSSGRSSTCSSSASLCSSEPASEPAAADMLPPGWVDAVAAEVEFQLSNFMADFGAFDLARLASGLADLRVQPGSELRRVLMKAVYSRVSTIEEKGAVDFALAKLNADGRRSMHYDPRWTHEELKWLPRRERDKRRIMAELYTRSNWGGWAPGERA